MTIKKYERKRNYFRIEFNFDTDVLKVNIADNFTQRFLFITGENWYIDKEGVWTYLTFENDSGLINKLNKFKFILDNKIAETGEISEIVRNVRRLFNEGNIKAIEDMLAKEENFFKTIVILRGCFPVKNKMGRQWNESVFKLIEIFNNNTFLDPSEIHGLNPV